MSDLSALTDDEAVAWLERSRDSKSPSYAQVCAMKLLSLLAAKDAEIAEWRRRFEEMHDHWTEWKGRRVEELDAEIAALRKERDEARIEVETGYFAYSQMTFRVSELERQHESAEREVERLREALTEIAERGCRHDTNPTMTGSNDTMWWYRYVQSMDSTVRSIARAALSASEPADEGAFGREVARQATHIKLPDGKVLRKPAASTEGGAQ